jgi:hypothetical protein
MTINNDNDGKPIGFIETLISNERVVMVNATQHATTITTKQKGCSKRCMNTGFSEKLALPLGAFAR